MKVTVEKVDDINYIVSGTVDNKVIEDKVAQFKEEAAKENKGEASSNEKIEQAAAGQVFNEFVEAGIKDSGPQAASMTNSASTIIRLRITPS